MSINWANLLNEIRYKGYSDESIARSCGWSQRRVYDCRVGRHYAGGAIITPPEQYREKLIELHRLTRDMPAKGIRNNFTPIAKRMTTHLIDNVMGWQTI